ncbi:DUF2062 domain-containing protein [Pararhizobium mangrovi]|uniref:DUF2062 domain-containing protein n=1 Tax=Pararhizobium mangrovi TaxID=2590452 RepID=A0A506UG89_9HYPH|nr:DUF2062 domain-containing protein [Pararhizobium mangrovi]TPW31999.1 DUF2062 domain-containing protein [Pararhizobium mangrovi]
MLFRRRKPATLWERIRVAIWPRRSFSRSIRYVVARVLRLTATPHAIAAGIAAGVFTSCTPFIGFHFILSFVVAYLIAGNMVAAAIGTSFGNPFTFPFIWAGAYELGTWILGTESVREKPIHLAQMVHDLDLADIWQPILKPMLVGGAPIGLVFAAAFYVLTYWGVNTFRRRRRLRIAARAASGGRQPRAPGRGHAA